MKMYKKLKFCLGLIGLITLSSIPMSITLVSCSKNSDDSSNSSNNVELEFEPNFFDNNKNPDVPIHEMNEERYMKIKNIIEQKDNINNSISNSSSTKNANQWLEQANINQIEDMLLINFNRFSDISYNSSNHYNDNSTWNSSTKSLLDINVTKYDSSSKKISFKIKEYYYKSRKEIYKNNDEITHENIKCYLEYEINNFELISYENSNLPTLTFNILNNDYSIKCTDSKIIYDCNDEKVEIAFLQKYKNELINNLYFKNEEEFITYLENTKNLINSSNNFINMFNNIKDLDWSNTKFDKSISPNINYFPLTKNRLGLSYPFEGWGYIGIDEIRKHEDNNWLYSVNRVNYIQPIFAICEFSDDGTSINIIKK